MRPVQLTFQAFGPYAEKVDLDFSKLGSNHLFVITGPTGSGKTTIFEAILYALYGVLSKQGMTHSEVRCDFLPDGDDRVTFVEYIFEVAGRRYRIYRQPPQILPKSKGNGMRRVEQRAELTCVGHDRFQPLTKNGEIHDKIHELIGLDVGQFKKIVMLPQGAFQDFLTSNTKDKMALLRDIFNTKMYADALETLKDDVRILQAAYQENKAKADAETGLLYFDMPLPEGELSDTWLKAVQSMFIEEGSSLHIIQEQVSDDKERLKNAQAAFEAQKGINERFDQLEALNLKLSDLETQLPLIKEKEARLVAARLAQPLAFRETQLKEEELFLSKIEQNLMTALENSAKFETQLNAAQEAHKKAVAEREVWRQKEKQLLQLEIYCRLLEEAKRAENVFAAAQKDLEAAEKKLAEHQSSVESALKAEEQLKLLHEQQAKDKAMRAALEAERITIGMRYAIARDYLDKRCQLDEAEKTLRNAEMEETHLAAMYQRARAAEMTQLAAHLAQELQEGEPCPVCGAVHHPKPALPPKDSGDVNAALSLWQNAQAELNAAGASVTALRNQIHEKAVSLSESEDHLMSDEQIQALYSTLLSEGKAKRHAIDILDENIRRQSEEEAILLKARSNRDEAAALLDKAVAGCDAVREKYDTCRLALYSANRQLEDMRNRDGSLYEEDDVVKLSQRIGHWHKSIDLSESTMKQAESTMNQAAEAFAAEKRAVSEQQTQLTVQQTAYGEHRNSFIEAVQTTFGNLSLYKGAHADIVAIDELQTECEEYRRLLSDASSKREMLAATLNGAVRVDLVPLEERCHFLENQAESSQRKSIALMQRHEQNNVQIEKLGKLHDMIQQVQDKYSIAGELLKLISGTNARKLSFETFVQSYYFEQMLCRANTRFAAMTEGRYSFTRNTEVADARRQAGLDICVMDQYTGKTRDVATLSGGESFKASLSLALGLSDVVTEESGGVELSTIFIDEGFGTLDEESLETTIETLINLQKSGRLVGVISHVEEIKERIPARLTVRASRIGSTAGFEVYE